MDRVSSNKYLSISILLISFLIFLIVNLSSNIYFKSIRLDLTDSKLYSLSAGSKQIISEIKEPITLRFYFSRKLARTSPFIINFADRITDLLRQYERQSKGKIKLYLIDPESFSAEEDEALNYGLQGVPADNEGNELYLGLVGTNSATGMQVMPFMQPNREENLEYDISQLIYNLVHTEPKIVGILSTLPINGDAYHRQSPWVITQQLSQLYDVQDISEQNPEISSDISTLVLIKPEYLNSIALTAINDYVMQGGHVLAFIDPITEVQDSLTAYKNSEITPEFKDLIKSWGIEYNHDQVVATNDNAKSVRFSQDGRNSTIRYPLWSDFTSNNFAKDDVLLTSMDKISVATPGCIKKDPNSEITFKPLIATSNQSMLVTKEQANLYKQDPSKLLREFTPEGQYTIAARITGKIKSAFDERKIDNANIILFADVDMLHDHFWIATQQMFGKNYAVPTSGNGNFVLSAVDNLSGSESLISIRNRGTFLRPFDTIKEIELASQQKYRATEEQLINKLETTKQKLSAIESQKNDMNSVLLNVQQRREEEAFRAEIIQTRAQLREVRHQLNKDIEQVQTKIKFLSVGLIPLLIVIFGATVYLLQFLHTRRIRMK